MDAKELEGTWSLQSWRQEYDDGRIIEPFGSDPVGFITYLGDRMSCLMSRKERTPFMTGTQWTASDDDKATAYGEFMAYAGRFTVIDDTVIHHVELSLFPNWIGANQARVIKKESGRLVLSGRLETGTPEARTLVAIWTRHQTSPLEPNGEKEGA